MGRVPLYPYRTKVPLPLYWLYRTWRVFSVACCFAGFWTGSFLAAWLVLPIVWLWPGTRAQKLRRGLACTAFGFRVFHFAMWALRLYHRVTPARSLRPGEAPVIIVSNHPTLCDVTSIVSLFPSTVAICGVTFSKNPLIARAVRLCGFVPAGHHVLADCQARLDMGFDVLVFPEGTRTPVDGPLHPFHRGAFELALRTKAQIVLVKLVCEPTALSKRLPIWKVADETAILTVEPFAVIDPAQYSDSRALCRAVEQRYNDLLYPREHAARDRAVS